MGGARASPVLKLFFLNPSCSSMSDKEHFCVTATIISGESKFISGLKPSWTLAMLYKRVALEFGIPLMELTLCMGQRAFTASDLCDVLSALGIQGGTDLAVVLQAAGKTAEAAEFRVMQGSLFKKPGQDPTTKRIVKMHRQVGSKISTTGRTWMGPSGGQWVELDPFVEKLGWLVLEGTSFGQPGLLLEKVEIGEEEPIVLRVRSPVLDDHMCDICLKPHETIRHVKYRITLCWPGLKLECLEIAKQDAAPLRNGSSGTTLANIVMVRDTSLKHGDELIYFYLGDAEEDIARARTGALSNTHF